MQETNTAQRSTLIDYLRCLAIFLMLFYHWHFDLFFSGYLQESIIRHPAFVALARLCLCLFLFCVGYSLALNYKRHCDKKFFWRSFLGNWIKVTVSAIMISIVTYMTYPQYWVYFGILHCISVASLIALAFFHLPKIALSIGIIMMTAYWGWDYSLPWINLQQPTLDHIDLFPWLGMVLIGLGAEHWQLHQKFQPKPRAWVLWVSKHSLIIYLLHQPLFMGLIVAYRYMA